MKKSRKDGSGTGMSDLNETRIGGGTSGGTGMSKPKDKDKHKD